MDHPWVRLSFEVARLPPTTPSDVTLSSDADADLGGGLTPSHPSSKWCGLSSCSSGAETRIVAPPTAGVETTTPSSSARPAASGSATVCQDLSIDRRLTFSPAIDIGNKGDGCLTTIDGLGDLSDGPSRSTHSSSSSSSSSSPSSTGWSGGADAAFKLSSSQSSGSEKDPTPSDEADSSCAADGPPEFVERRIHAGGESAREKIGLWACESCLWFSVVPLALPTSLSLSNLQEGGKDSPAERAR